MRQHFARLISGSVLYEFLSVWQILSFVKDLPDPLILSFVCLFIIHVLNAEEAGVSIEFLLIPLYMPGPTTLVSAKGRLRREARRAACSRLQEFDP